MRIVKAWKWQKKDSVALAIFAAEKVAYLWKDKYPDKYKIWKDWVDSGCPAAAADAKKELIKKNRIVVSN